MWRFGGKRSASSHEATGFAFCRYRLCLCMPWANYAGKMVNRRSTFSQPLVNLVNLVNLHDAWQWDSGVASRLCSCYCPRLKFHGFMDARGCIGCTGIGLPWCVRSFICIPGVAIALDCPRLPRDSPGIALDSPRCSIALDCPSIPCDCPRLVFVLMRFPASQMCFLSENDVWYAS